MSALLEQIKSSAFQLSVKERAELASLLLHSLDPETDVNAKEAWDAELMRRAAEIRNGTAHGRPAEEVFPELRDRQP